MSYIEIICCKYLIQTPLFFVLVVFDLSILEIKKNIFLGNSLNQHVVKSLLIKHFTCKNKLRVFL